MWIVYPSNNKRKDQERMFVVSTTYVINTFSKSESMDNLLKWHTIELS